VACIPKKQAEICGNALILILATAVMPEILHSDNGGEFTENASVFLRSIGQQCTL
jgi:hypothetical protein